MNHSVGVKHYGFTWFERSRGDYRLNAEALVAHAVDFAILQNLIAPVPTTAAATALQPGSSRARLRSQPYDDTRLREALRERGIEFYEVLPMFFDPSRARRSGNLTPVADTGMRMRRRGWYVGLCPTDSAYLEDRVVAAERIVEQFRPKGLYLDWIRFPGFWEMWMPDTKRADLPEYCFCDRCTGSFQEHSGVELPNRPSRERASLISHELRREWTDWKCSVIADAVGEIKRGAQRHDPNIEIMTSNVAFGAIDYENAIEEVLGQRIELMAQHADRLTFMFYHQIVRREPGPWIAQLADEIEQRTTRPFLATLQVKPAYLEPQFAAGRRNATISLAEHVAALRSAAASPADGVVLYHWSDYLETDDIEDAAFKEAVWSYREGTIAS